MRRLLWWLLLAPLCSASPDGEAPVVDTYQGRLRGLNMISRSGRPFHAFLGIPYSPPPVGRMRFQVSKRFEKWDGEWDGTKEGNRCPQLDDQGQFVGSEDCLYLNVYTPKLPDPKKDRDLSDDLSVIVVIHGGGFTVGDGGLSSFSPEHFMDHDVVLVTFNYRLGPIGFLATGDPYLPGNYGLKDQFRVLSWVRRHITYFGGHPGLVTLLGVEAGAASAHYHMFTDFSKGRFLRVVSLSGTALSPWAHVSTHESRRRAFRLGQLVGCPEEQLQDAPGLKDCLVTKSAKELVTKAAQVLDWSVGVASPFAPVREPIMPRNRTFIYERVEKMIEVLGKQRFQPNWLIGTTSGEGIARARAALSDPEVVSKLNEDPGRFVPRYLGLVVEGGDKLEREVGRRIWDHYMQGRTLSEDTIDSFVQMTSDFITYYGVSRSVEEHTENTTMPMFVYHFSWKGKDNEHALGVPQGYDMHLMLPKSDGGKKPTFNEEEYEFADKLIQIIVNFANEGDPTYDEFAVLENVIMPDAVYSNFSYLLVDRPLGVQDGGLLPERAAFWEETLREVVRTSRALEEMTREERQSDSLNLKWLAAQAAAIDSKPPSNERIKLEL